jgi:hypothetical protein
MGVGGGALLKNELALGNMLCGLGEDDQRLLSTMSLGEICSTRKKGGRGRRGPRSYVGGGGGKYWWYWY